MVLDVALRLGKLLHDRLGAEIIYTRSDDTFIPLETRTAIANKAQADLFLSIHANSSPDASARGVETYYLNFTSDPTALDVAARENAVSDQSIHQLSDLVKKIALKDKIAESREFADDVEDRLYAGLQRGNPGLKDRGVKKAPFVVLIGANMPSILAEDLVCDQSEGRDGIGAAGVSRTRCREPIQGRGALRGRFERDAVATERAAVGRSCSLAAGLCRCEETLRDIALAAGAVCGLAFLDVVSVPLGNLDDVGPRLLDDGLASKARVELDSGSRLHAVELLVLGLADALGSLLHMQVAGGAGADTAAGVVEKYAIVHRYVEEGHRLAMAPVGQCVEGELHGSALWQKRDPHHALGGRPG